MIWRRPAYCVLDPHEHGRAASAHHWLHHGFVILGIAAMVLLTVPDLTPTQRWGLGLAFNLALAFFAIEYLARGYVVP
ncbi:MAG: hypothetical protein JO010_00075, partial [Alphaproteobacteria bacterium]|nr:hypothetical protein [Alphaproteobacteria bacterium]